MSDTVPGQGDDSLLGVRISHADKAVWPAGAGGGAITKIELARYLVTAAPRLLSFVSRRPCAVVRAPSGIQGGRFFQRHAATGTPVEIDRIQVAGVDEPFLAFETPQSLVAAVQWGVVEFHPGNGAPGRPDVPGRLVFDLDPDEALPFDRVAAAAQEVRDRLTRLGLTSVVKTTGGKGLHVVAPLDASGDQPAGWPEAEAFARGLGEAMAADRPDRFTIHPGKDRREGLIFVDYLRNVRTASAVAVLSPRARPGAPVSWPVSWRELEDPDFDPKAFNLRCVRDRLGENDPWADWEHAAVPLRELVARSRR